MYWLARSARTGCLIVLFAVLGAAPAQEPKTTRTYRTAWKFKLVARPRGLRSTNYPKPEPGQLLAKEPPPPVPEEPPDYRPEGKNVTWIPGYWAWDAERKDFLWVSGTYRDRAGRAAAGCPATGPAPTKAGAGSPASGRRTEQTEVPYTPEPPEPFNNEPNLPAPDDDSTWVPGYWHYNQAALRGGRATGRRNTQSRVWVSPRYTWSIRLSVLRRLLGLSARRSRPALRAGVLQSPALAHGRVVLSALVHRGLRAVLRFLLLAAWLVPLLLRQLLRSRTTGAWLSPVVPPSPLGFGSLAPPLAASPRAP